MTEAASPGFFMNLWRVVGNYRYCQFQEEVYSFWSILCNKRKLRKDYIQYTACKYAWSVRRRHAGGHMPEDYNHTKETYWERELADALTEPSSTTTGDCL